MYYNNGNKTQGVIPMKFSNEKKNSIIMYMLEKIELGEADISKTIAEKCEISRNTVNEYLIELQEKNIIRKIKRNQYELVTETFKCLLERSKNQLNSDTYAFDSFFNKHIQDCTSQAKTIWQYALSEMTNNVIDHSNAETLLFKVEKNYLKTKAYLLDDGVGIFEKIKEHFELESLDEARCELFKGKLTTDKSKHSGEGIFFTSRMMDSFCIISDRKVFDTNKYNDEFNYDIDSNIIKGTCVIMTLSNFTQKRIADIFNQYSSPDGGFTKTDIPLKNIFDSAPISRSQAKRIYYRLDEFNNVTLDFEGLDWMGQAFAHQLFVVYQNQHPNTVLLPINMCEDVKAMYDHVMYTNADQSN